MQDLRPFSWLRYVIQVLFVACMYFVLARISLLLQFEDSNAAPVWPAAGFAFAMILIWGGRIAPGILLGAFAANFMIFANHETLDLPAALLMSVIIALGNTLEALAGKFLINRFVTHFDTNTFLDTVDHILQFALVAGIMCLSGSTIGTLTDYFAGIITFTQVPIVWITWWLGDFSGILLTTTFILIWIKSFRKITPQHLQYKRSNLETVLFFISVVISGGIVFDNWFFNFSFFQWAFWVIPILVWAALRFSQQEIIATLAVYSIMAVWGTVHFHGPFSGKSLNEALLAVQAFIAIMVITKLTLNATVSKRKETEIILRHTGEELETRVRLRTALLEERNQFVETIFNSSNDSIVILDKNTTCIFINKAAKNQLRLPYPENVIGRNIFELPSFVIPAEARENILRALNGETVNGSKFASPISDKYFEVDYIPVKNHQGEFDVMIVGHDITRRMHAEHEIREQKTFAEMLIESSPYMIMAYDKDFHVTAWNKKSEEFIGYKKDQVIGNNVFELFPQYNNETWINMLSSVMKDGKALHFPKIKFLQKPGWGESFMTPLYNSQQEIVGLLSITHEISELVNMTNILEQKNKDLIKTNEELSSFAYVASHDLQEPLRKIQIFARRIVDSEYDTLSESGKDFFDRMRSAAARMQLLIEDLLAYSRTGTQERNFEKVPLQDIVDEVKDNLKDEIAQKQAVIESEDLCDCNVIVFQMRQLLHNLFTNSLKFAKPGENPHIRISSKVALGSEFQTEDLEPQKEYCYIRVEDNGIGFEPEFNEQIFGLFQRLHGKNEYPGTGIGLAICKKIVENHNGIIRANGEPGKGATFHIYLPNEVQY